MSGSWNSFLVIYNECFIRIKLPNLAQIYGLPVAVNIKENMCPLINFVTLICTCEVLLCSESVCVYFLFFLLFVNYKSVGNVVIKNICNNYLEKKKENILCFINIKKATSKTIMYQNQSCVSNKYLFCWVISILKTSSIFV